MARRESKPHPKSSWFHKHRKRTTKGNFVEEQERELRRAMREGMTEQILYGEYKQNDPV